MEILEILEVSSKRIVDALSIGEAKELTE